MNGNIISKTEFYGSSDYAKSLRKIYNNDYNAYYAKYMPIYLENPLKANHENYIAMKRAEYLQALTNLNKDENIWNGFKGVYEGNLARLRKNNNGHSLSFSQKASALSGAGTGASAALLNFNRAKFEEEYAFSLLRDASSGSVSLLS